ARSATSASCAGFITRLVPRHFWVQCSLCKNLSRATRAEIIGWNVFKTAFLKCPVLAQYLRRVRSLLTMSPLSVVWPLCRNRFMKHLKSVSFCWLICLGTLLGFERPLAAQSCGLTFSPNPGTGTVTIEAYYQLTGSYTSTNDLA